MNGSPPTHGDYRAYVGPAENYDRSAALQFSLLAALGLRETDYLLDIGCGSLRVGKLLIPYLLPGHYYGIEPNSWLVSAGVEKELGTSILDVKKPTFAYNANFDCGQFGRKFDFVIAQSVFSHASARQISDCMSSVSANLAPCGVFLATFLLGDRDYDGEEWVYPGCVTYTEAAVDTFGHKVGLSSTKVEWAHPLYQTWFAFTGPENLETLRAELSKDGVVVQALLHDRAILRDRYQRLEQHPYVRFGLAVRTTFNKLRAKVARP
jgi:cyclopropane fatty-acyl-phospholipid synthase-like methyltransferase